ncbi:sugar porter family MFS transporter [Agrococcus sp. HG114]|uniref:sugar porter family MFS transporter n=1 Tax=Agrococcus sp. HG114 TaxID=2969757 RepID=UPI00215AC6AF|nr:sugar porter family MFS transporter [Agrococcus sp. HG114]MCR8671225.1 sugar porter family MFS transporter [Agrococcus sp. HG114]
MPTAPPSTRAEAAVPPLAEGPHRARLGVISIVACLGGLLFGYDTGVINGSLQPMSAELGLGPLGEGVVTSSLVFAAALGALVGGRLSDAVGRRTMLLALATLFFAGTLVVVVAPGLAAVVAGRVLLGLAVGGASTVVPVYLAELAPFEIRGSFSGRNEVAIVSGQLAAFVVNALLGSALGHVEGIWRAMFAVCALPALALFVGMLRMPESPRWLAERGRREEALAVLRSVRAGERAEAELAHIEARLERSAVEPAGRATLRALLADRWLRRVLLVGVGVGVAQQLTGINAIMYYGATVLEESGFDRSAALVANIAPGVIAVVGGLVALRLMDRVDRRTTLLIGFSLTTACHALIGLASSALEPGDPIRPFVILALVVAFVGAMQTFLNVATWVYLSEIFPLRVRGLGIGVAVFAHWLANGALALAFPSLLAAVGITGAFFLFAGVGALALWFIAARVFETRGRSLEALEGDVASGALFARRGARG